MFKLDEKYEVDQKTLKCDYMRYSPSEISTIKTANSQIKIKIPGDYSVFSLVKSYFELNFDVLHSANNSRYADNNGTRLVILSPIALFSYYKLSPCSDEHIEEVNHVDIVSFMC